MEKLFIRKNNQKGFVLIITLILLGLLLFLGTYFMSFTFSESKISNSYEITTKSYYLSEAGINEAIWKLKNDEIDSDGDDAWKKCFIEESVDCDCKTWSDTFYRNYDENSTTVISISNSECARGEIIATTTIFFSKGKTAQRVVKVKVFKAIGGLVLESPFFSGTPSGETTISASNLNIYDGNLLNLGTLNVKLNSVISVFDNQLTAGTQEGQILSNANINLDSGAVINSSNTCSANICYSCPSCEPCEKCPADTIAMPAIDFDSASPSSYKSKALEAENLGLCKVRGYNSGGGQELESSKCIFTESEFEDLLWGVNQNGKLVLESHTDGSTSSVYYVEGIISLKGARTLEVNGVLLADKTIEIGEKEKWTKGGQTHSGPNQITVYDPGTNIPSGLLTKSKINFGPYSSFENATLTGLIYSHEEATFNSMPDVFNIWGGAISRKIYLNSITNGLNIYLNNEIIREGIWGGEFPPTGPIPYSPVVTIEHWEESY